MKKILVIDDDVDMCLLLKLFLSRKGYEVIVKYTGTEGLDYIEHSMPDLVICDLRLDDTDGMEILKKAKEIDNNLPVIIVTAYDDIKISVKAIELGAFNYITKPILPDEIYTIVQYAIDAKNNEQKSIQQTFSYPASADTITGSSELFKKTAKQIELVASTDHNIIIYGETGSGKKIVGQQIHNQSNRKSKPFVVANCSILSKENDDMNAIIEKANGGTLFLENVKDLPDETQLFLFNVIKEKKIKKNTNGNVDIDLRIVASSNEMLWNAVIAGLFREDFFHRLNDFNIELFPLRSRKDEILLFGNHFLKSLNKKFKKNIQGFMPEVETIFKNYTWPGNLRELNNVITKAVLLSTKDTVKIDIGLLPEEIKYFNKTFFNDNGIFTSKISLEKN
jgi:two-component system response regulator HydG